MPAQSKSTAGNDLITPDSPRSDIVVNSRRPTGRLPSASDQQVVIVIITTIRWEWLFQCKLAVLPISTHFFIC